MRSFITAVAAILMLVSCASHRNGGDTSANGRHAETSAVIGMSPLTGGSVSTYPHARIYRTTAPSDSLVPITLSPDGTTVTSFPDPRDLSTVPPRLTDGWLLDTRGITPLSAFTSFTYSEYKAMPDSPTPGHLLHAVIPGLKVSEIVELPGRIGQATPAMADSLIRAGLPGCKTIFKL